jgi:tRNA pseudouridine55 synthase
MNISNQPPEFGPLDGVLIVDKPAGITSHDVVHKIRRNFKIRKVGHGGTLDPNATGLLVILLGKGTKLSNSVMSGDKTYQGKILLGVETDSQDCDGEVVAEKDPAGITEEQIRKEIKTFIGDFYQTPPMVSAIKINGEALYKAARRGEVVERKERFVHVYSFNINNFNMPYLDVTIKCTKGTYIRTIAHDLGQKLGCGANLVELRRLASGCFSLDNAITLDEIMNMTSTQLAENVITVPQVALLNKKR